ncbi:M61 family metallopeptidase [Arenibacter troitsensis]|uniref:Predicted metalloprotease, contains C-terminal PDZ domain n=1 Tax=Arenibacter troitsensis TaxID=188872 RepID=A0A1X7HYT5_9FLAO|nr:peptidase M61 [Arenibacter troitsensis]SMG06599.1 Predicted metalloprotease, contains C-terminal PDZ domain [Arenibacter troitsensis]
MTNRIGLIKKTWILGAAILVLHGCGTTKKLVSAEKTSIIAKIDLINVVDDKVNVILDPTAFATDTVSFFIPKTVPGTYSDDNYGKYIEQFKALDYKGGELKVEKLDDNTWRIINAKDLDRINYWVNDTYDTEVEVSEPVFSPSGTNILKGKNFMLNLHGFVGYFDGLEEIPYSLEISAPDGLEPVTSLVKGVQDVNRPDTDVFVATRYFEVIDNPIMYSDPSTETFQVNDIAVTLSVYSPNGHFTAASLKAGMEKMMRGQKAFLGDINSTKHYTIILYLSNMDDEDAKGFGALEHHTSTVVVMPEQISKERLEEAIFDTVAHEFFHIVTPLTIHSNEIQYFDFNDPKMSMHLWMYEGTTEYFANLFQIQQGLISEEDFYQRLMEKVERSKTYDDSMSFTVMSKNILEEPYKKNYANVYEKGALINMAIDIDLRKLSGGEKGVLWLMKELSKKYGDSKPFEDDGLIDEIVEMTYPEIGKFFNGHVIGDTPIDYDAYWKKVGLSTTEQEQSTGYFFDGEIPYIDVDPANDNAIFVREGIQLNSFFNDLGAQGGDIIKSVDGKMTNLVNIRLLIGQSMNWDPDKEIVMVVQRGDEEITLKGKVGVPTLKVVKLVPIEGASEQQKNLREAWLKG